MNGGTAQFARVLAHTERGLFADRVPGPKAEPLIDKAWPHLDYLQHCDPADLRANRRGLIELREMLDRAIEGGRNV